MGNFKIILVNSASHVQEEKREGGVETGWLTPSYVSGSVHGFSHVSSHVIFMKDLWGWVFLPYFIDEETETQRN